jgi:hypothetical protein
MQAKLQTDLRDPKQRVNTLSTANLKVLGDLFAPRGVDFGFDVRVRELRLEAPPLRLAALPQLAPDRRFVRKPVGAPPPTKSKFQFLWHGHIQSESPILVDSNLLRTPIPFAVNMQLAADKPLTGDLQVLALPIEIFGKKANVDHIKVTYLADSKLAALDGLVLYENPEVKVSIQLLGTTERPQVELQSDPPLGRQQILSVLLFNKSLYELTDEELNTAANMSKAFSDGAFGLFSLIFLSATPIQSINYDPTTESYSARLKIDDKTTLAVSSDFEQSRQFTVRRRLGGHWAIRTELREKDTEEDVVLTLLEWFKRY